MSAKSLYHQSAASALAVAADFRPDPKGPKAGDRVWVSEFVRGKVLNLADDLNGLDVCLKMNSALRLGGYSLITEVQERGLRVFADLKFSDIKETLAIDGALISVFKPNVVTVMCNAGTTAVKELKEGLPGSEVIGVTVLTSLSEAECMNIYGVDILQAVGRLAEVGKDAGLEGLVSSSKEVPHLVAIYGQKFSYTAAAIRPEWFLVEQDDQNPDRTATPEVAMGRGVTRLVIGRPITGSKDRRAAALRTIDEMALALSKMERAAEAETQ